MKQLLIRIQNNLAVDVIELAKQKGNTPSGLVNNMVREYLGRGLTTTVTPIQAQNDEGTVNEVDGTIVEAPGPSVLDTPWSNLTGNDMREINQWQVRLKDKEEEYERMLNGVAPEDRELEKESDYVVEVVNEIKEARDMLVELGAREELK